MIEIKNVEFARLELQKALDSGKSQAERNRFGQFATPTRLAKDVIKYSKLTLPEGIDVKFIDPAIGTGSFYSALISTFPSPKIRKAVGFEIDPYYGIPAADLWKDFDLRLYLSDFTKMDPPPEKERFNLLICNPPYVRHHHLNAGDKARLRNIAQYRTGVKVSGLTGLYCYFILLANDWLSKDGIAGWLIPSEFMDVNYGKVIKEFLLNNVTLLRIHRFDPQEIQFDDAIVSSSIVWYKKRTPPKYYDVEFSFGGSLINPKIIKKVTTDILREEPKWTRFPVNGKRIIPENKLSDYFVIKRGIATGNNKFFILTKGQIEEKNLPLRFLKPILPSPRFIKTDEITADKYGNPLTDPQHFLLDCALSENEIIANYPSLWAYLEEGIRNGINRTYLCLHRTPWYSQENRRPSPIICTYMGRHGSYGGNGKPFRFLLNHSNAIVANVYLMLYPKPTLARAIQNNSELIRTIWNSLKHIDCADLVENGRVYGGGLQKLEPKELANVPLNIKNKIPSFDAVDPEKQAQLF